jgi:hypothetical protein
MRRRDSGRVRYSQVGALVCALVLAACDTTKPTPNTTSETQFSDHPAASQQLGSDAPTVNAGSVQAMIAADLAAGTIDLGTSLAYRAWAVFADARLPARYDGAPSTGRDTALFDDIADALPSLPAEERAVLEPFLKRPTDPASAWSAGTTGTAGARLTAFTAAATDRCVAPLSWWSREWSPDASADHGVKVYACGDTAESVRDDLQAALDIAERLWPAMTAPVPAGMGQPVPDIGVPDHGGNGKLDVYILDKLAPCRQRGDACQEITGSAVAMTVKESECVVTGSPELGCPSYMLLGRERLRDSELAGDFAHEFFHVLQFAHNGAISRSWYMDSTATWAEWQFVVRAADATQPERDATKANLWSLFESYQERRQSLLRVDPDPNSDNTWEYEAWMWPLFEAVQTSPRTIFETWKALEGAKTLEAADRVIDGELGFISNFHEFAVWNAQPADYAFDSSTGLEDVSWQSKQNLGGLPRTFHALQANAVAIALGKQTFGANVEQLAAQYDSFRITDEAIRQVSIDITQLKNAKTADLDVLAQLEPRASGPADEWRRVAGPSGRVTFCRDAEQERISLFEVVISNHSSSRIDDLLPQDDKLGGSYTIKAKDKCDVPDGFEGTFSGSNSGNFSWHGTARFELMQRDDPAYECSVDPGVVEYCYRFVSGDATWTWPPGHGANACPGGTTTVSLSTADRDDGIIHVLVASDEEPDQAGTYFGGVTAGGHQGGAGCTSHNTSLIVAWIAMGSPAPRFGAGYQLSGTYTNPGCGLEGCGTQSWTWDLAPFFKE